MTAWNVYQDTLRIDTVFYVSSMTRREVYRSLIAHDGYPADIWVQKARS